MSFDPNRPINPEPAPTMSPTPPATPESAVFPTQPVPAAAPTIKSPGRRSSAVWLNVVLVLAALVAVGGVAFAVGRNTAPVAAAGPRGGGNFQAGDFPQGSFAPGASGAPGGGFLGAGAGGRGGFNLSGTVQSVTGDTLTITTANGQTLEFSLGADTTYDAKTPVTASEVQPGAKVEVQLAFGAGGAGAGLGGRANASAAPSGPIGTASSVTVVP